MHFFIQVIPFSVPVTFLVLFVLGRSIVFFFFFFLFDHSSRFQVSWPFQAFSEANYEINLPRFDKTIRILLLVN